MSLQNIFPKDFEFDFSFAKLSFTDTNTPKANTPKTTQPPVPPGHGRQTKDFKNKGEAD